jgi:hypothetical protein
MSTPKSCHDTPPPLRQGIDESGELRRAGGNEPGKLQFGGNPVDGDDRTLVPGSLAR